MTPSKKTAKSPKKKKSNSLNFNVVAICVCVLLTLFIGTLIFMNATYINNTRQILLSRSEIDNRVDWERMPENEQREVLYNRYYEIVKYYIIDIPIDRTMDDGIILDSFETLYNCTKAVNVDFFLPIAFMKVVTNFNPVHRDDTKFGIGAFFVKEAEIISNLPIIKNSEMFNVDFVGEDTLYNPIESIKLLVAKIDSLNKTFYNRTDWVILCLIKTEYEVIDKWWNDGKGNIPDEFYRSGQIQQIRQYYNLFKFGGIEITPEEQIIYE